MPQFPFQSGDRILFQGDSITDCGRRDDPLGLGAGYPAVIKGFLAALAPDKRIEVLNRGISGNRSNDLLARWQADCLDLSPTHVSIMIGVNDIWHSNVGKGIALPDYKANMRRIIESTLAAGVKNLVLMTPTTVDADPRHECNLQCAEYAAAVEAFAAEYKCVLVPARDRMWAAVRSGPSVEFYLPDGVHPSLPGHAVLAAAWLGAIGI